MDMQRLMQEAQKMQKEMAKLQAELDATVYTGNAQGEEGVTISINGKFEVQEVKIAKELMGEDNQEILQDMIMVAFNEAIDKANKERAEKMNTLTAGVQMPGM